VIAVPTLIIKDGTVLLCMQMLCTKVKLVSSLLTTSLARPTPPWFYGKLIEKSGVLKSDVEL